MGMRNKAKRSQSEVITTLLLVLVGIAATVLVSAFVINLVKDNLKGTECFKTAGMFSVNVADGNTYYDSDADELYLNIERDVKNIDISGIYIVYGDEFDTQKLQIDAGKDSDNVFYRDSAGEWSNTAVPVLDMGVSRTYKITEISKIVTKASVAPILANGKLCEKTDEQEIPAKTPA